MDHRSLLNNLQKLPSELLPTEEERLFVEKLYFDALSVSPLAGPPLLENKDLLLSGEEFIVLFPRAFRALGISLADFAKRLNETIK